MKVTTPVIQVILAIFTIGFLPKVQAVVPAPAGGYPGGNTAEGQNALLNLTTGGFNTALGFLSLKTDATGQLNTAVGAGTLLTNTSDNKPFACWHQPFKPTVRRSSRQISTAIRLLRSGAGAAQILPPQRLDP